MMALNIRAFEGESTSQVVGRLRLDVSRIPRRQWTDIERNNGVIKTIQGQAFLTFPEPGGCKIIWEPGALHMLLTKAASGHLCLEVDHYDKIPSGTQGGIADSSTRVLYSGQSSNDSSSSSTPATSRTVDAGTQTDPWLPAS